MWRGFQQAFPELVTNFKEVNKMVIIVQHSNKLLKGCENHQRIKSTDQNVQTFSKNILLVALPLKVFPALAICSILPVFSARMPLAIAPTNPVPSRREPHRPDVSLLYPSQQKQNIHTVHSKLFEYSVLCIPSCKQFTVYCLLKNSNCIFRCTISTPQWES